MSWNYHDEEMTFVSSLYVDDTTEREPLLLTADGEYAAPSKQREPIGFKWDRWKE